MLKSRPNKDVDPLTQKLNYISMVVMRYLGIIGVITMTICCIYLDVNYTFLLLSIVTGGIWCIGFMSVWRYDSLLLILPTILIPVYSLKWGQKTLTDSIGYRDYLVWWSGMFSIAGIILWLFKSKIEAWCNLVEKNKTAKSE